MANTLDALMPKILARGLLALRGFTVLPRLVNTDYSNEARQKGNTIDVPVPGAVTAVDVTPGATPPANTDSSWSTVQVPLDKWKEAPFYLTDKEEGQILTSEFLPLQAGEAVKSLGQAVNADIFGCYKGIYGYVGTAGTTPFATSGGVGDISAATSARKVLNAQFAPLANRSLVLDVDAGANALGLPQFANAAAAADNKVITEGVIGRKLGFDWFEDQQTPTHAAGTITTGLAAKAATAQAVGDTTIVCTTAASTGACALKEGDIITFAGDSQTYVLTADAAQASAAADVTLNIQPPLKVALAGGEAVTVKASHVVNLAFNKYAIALAVRPLADTMGNELGAKIMSATDPITGLTLRLEVTRQHKQTRYSYDILYGVKLVRRELACRVAG